MNLPTKYLVHLTIVIALLSPGVAGAQGSKEDYDRADGLRKRFLGMVFRDRVDPHWIGESSRFWYEVKTAEKNARFIMVDAEAGMRKEAFDHEQLAEALSEATGKPTNADRLPLRDLEFVDDGAVIEFVTGHRGYRYALAGPSLGSGF